MSTNGKDARDAGACAPVAPDGQFVPRPFRPSVWLPGRHLQTIAGRFLRRFPEPAFRRERIELPDGDFVDLDHPPGPQTEAPVVLVMHGLEGSARRGYAINTYLELAQRGIRPIGLNFRSCSGEPNRHPRFYHSGDTADIAYVLSLLALRYPHVPRAAIGFSLGGNALLKLLGEMGAAARELVTAAAAVSVPYDLGAGSDSLDASFMGRMYVRVFVKSLIAKADAKGTLLAGRCDIARVRAARSFREFDDAVTAPLHGFAGAEDYYTRSSARAYLHGIELPTLLVHAADDPFLPLASFPHEAVRHNPWLQAVVTPRGGHVGFIEGTPWAPRFWVEETTACYLAARLRADQAAI